MADGERRPSERPPSERRPSERPPSERRTVVGMPVVDRLVIMVAFPGGGLLLGWLLPVLARWLVDLRGPLPFGVVFRFLAGLDTPVESTAAMGVGLLVGLGVAAVAVTETLTVALTDAQLTVGRDRTVPRADVAAVFVDGKRLVVLDRHSRVVVDAEHPAPATALAAAFRDHGYPWHDEDPYAGLYRRWIPGSPELPPAADAVLAARAAALEKKSAPDIDELRNAVEKLGFAVRDEGFRQYWRPLVRS